ncbi:MAG TPA: hypothetical protein VI542_25930 [Candidatus Tectomicrobia bacterium]
MSGDPSTYETARVPAPFPQNDRTWLAETQAALQQEQRAEEELRAHEVMGAGAAAFCVSFWETIRGAEPASEMRFSRDETLRLLEAALRGR